MAQIPAGVTFDTLLHQLGELHRSEVAALHGEVYELKVKLGLEVPHKNNVQDFGMQEPNQVWQKNHPRSSEMTVATTRRSHLVEKTGLEWIVEHHIFEAIFGALILLNALIMALEVQYKGIDVEADLAYRGKSTRASDEWPGATTAFEVLDWFFGILFTGELVAKVVGLRLRFFTDAWNVIDGFIVLTWVFGRAFSGLLPLSPAVLRMIRLARLLRTLRLVRKISTFDALYLMMASIKGSLTILIWTIMFLVLTEMFMALVMSQLLNEYYFNNGEDCNAIDSLNSTWSQNRCESLTAEKVVLFQYFGTFTRALFSMFELTLGNWPPISRALSEYLSQWFMLLALIHKLTLGFAILGVINGVFMQETFKVAALDDELITRQKKRIKQAHRKKMTTFFEHADRSDDDAVSLKEFRRIMKDDDFKIWLSAMEFDVQPDEVDKIYNIMDKDNTNSLSVEELVAGVGRLKGGAKSIHAITTLMEIEEIKKLICGLAQQLNNGLQLPNAGVPVVGAKPDGVPGKAAKILSDGELIPTSPEGQRGSEFGDEARNEDGDLTGKLPFKAKKSKVSKKSARIAKSEFGNSIPKDSENGEAFANSPGPADVSQHEAQASGESVAQVLS